MPIDSRSNKIYIILSAIVLIVIIIIIVVIFQEKSQRLSSDLENINAGQGAVSLEVTTSPSDALLILFNIEDESELLKGNEIYKKSPARFENIESGLYQINVDKEGYCPVFQEVQIKSGQENKIDIELNKEPCE